MDYKQEAEKIVEMFMPYVYSTELTNPDNPNEYAIQCAIKHVEGMIRHNAKPDEDYWKSILNQLKQM